MVRFLALRRLRVTYFLEMLACILAAFLNDVRLNDPGGEVREKSSGRVLLWHGVPVESPFALNSGLVCTKQEGVACRRLIGLL